MQSRHSEGAPHFDDTVRQESLSNSATLASRRVSAMMLLLALELLAIALCSGSARSEPGPNDTTTGAIADELRGAGRESAAV